MASLCYNKQIIKAKISSRFSFGQTLKMSRIIVKNLPKYINQERLSEHFKSRGQITDVKMVSRDGVFRRFAYIGFKTDEQAKSAIEHFNNTFFDTCRISVELAFSINSESLARPWSKYSTGSSAHTKQLPVEPKVLSEVQKSFLEDIGMDDPKLDEYLSVMKSKANEKTWGNDDVLDIAKHNQVNAAPADSEDELYDELPPAVGKQEGAIEPSAVAASISAVDAPISDMEYLRSKMAARPEPQELQVVNIHPSRLAALDESGAIDSTLISNNFQHTEQPQHQEVQVQVESQVTTEPEELPADIIADTARLMIKNLPYSCTTEDLETLFVTFGPITEVHIPISRETKSSRGYAFVLFMLPEHAMAAFTQLDQTIFQGRIIEITPAKEKPAAVEELPTGPQSFKAKREQDRKTASSSDFNWNSLFMNVLYF